MLLIHHTVISLNYSCYQLKILAVCTRLKQKEYSSSHKLYPKKARRKNAYQVEPQASHRLL